MTLAVFATFSTAISGLAVTASLIYLALQTHQAAKHTKALIEQGRTARMTDMLIGISNTDFVTAIIKGHGGTVTPDTIDSYKYVLYCGMIMAGLEDTFGQHEQGLISEDRFKSHSISTAILLSFPGFRSYWDQWRATRVNTQEAFKAWMDEIATKTPVSSFDSTVAMIVPPHKS